MHQRPVSWSARAPRVAILMPPVATNRWHREWAHAWEFAGRCWGGEAAVLVPVSEDGIDRRILRVLSAYDPDYYLPWQTSLGAAKDAWLPQSVADDLTLHTSGQGPWDDRFPGGIAGPDLEPGYPLSTVPTLETQPTSLRTTEPLPDSVLVMIAARHGTTLAGGKEARVVSGYQAERWTSGKIDDYSVAGGHDVRTPFAAGRQGLDWFTRGAFKRRAALVIGDSAEDHALAMLVDRLYGPGAAHWSPASGEDIPEAGLVGWLRSCDRAGIREILVASLTVPVDELSRRSATLANHQTGVRINGGPVPFLRFSKLCPVDAMEIGPLLPRAELADGHRLHLASPMSFSEGQSLPPTPTPPVPRVAEGQPTGTVQWIVDAMVGGLGMPPRGTFTEPSPGFESPVRASLGGWSWSALSHLIVAVDVAAVHHMSLPASLREPSARASLTQLGHQAGIDLRPSNLDVAYNTTIERWGGLPSLATTARDSVTWATLRELAGLGETASVIKGLGQPPMSLQGIRAATGFQLTVDRALDLVNEWATRGIVHRGYCLKCPDCRHADHYRLEVIGSGWRCERCRGDHDLSRGWPLKHPSPPIYFVLDELVRIAIADNIEVPVLALETAQKRKPSGFDWVVGLEAVDRRGRVITDIDYAYLSGTQLVIGEAKSNGRLKVDELSSLRDLGRSLTVDTIELATTSSSWKSSHIADIKSSWRPDFKILVGEDLGIASKDGR